MSTRVKLYYWSKIPNFGDMLNPYLLKRFAQVEAVYAEPAAAELTAVGSVLHSLPKDYSGYILGSGKLMEYTQIPRSARVIALRGPLSAKGVKGNIALGDPGILADELVHTETRRYELGIVPHWSDSELARRPEFLKYKPLIIDPCNDPLTVVKQIGECKKIVASSLHGIIIADAFGIPRRIEMAAQMVSEGGSFKFRDYSAAVGTTFEPGRLKEANRYRVQDMKDRMYDAYASFGDLWCST